MKLNVLSSSAKAWASHKWAWGKCLKCEIGAIARHHVFTRGQLPCDILFIGEAPGVTENVVGVPFIGRAGKLLDEWILAGNLAFGEAMAPNASTGFTYAITNLVLCRPTNCLGGKNRAPTYEEISNCRPRLEQFVADIARPRAIVTLGNQARDNAPISEFKRAGIELCHLYHPAWVLRQGGEGSPEDLREREKLTAFLQKIVAGMKGTK